MRKTKIGKNKIWQRANKTFLLVIDWSQWRLCNKPTCIRKKGSMYVSVAGAGENLAPN